MPHNRFFTDSDFSHTDIVIQGEEAHHMKDVMRLEVQDTIELINGRGSLAHARINKISKVDLSLTIEKVEICKKEKPILCSGLPLLRPSHFDWALEKLVELNVDTIFIFPADLSERKEMYDSFSKRCKKIVESAMKQSGRLFSPELILSHDLHDILLTSGTILWADESAQKTLIKTLQEEVVAPPLLLLTGPEKGWSDREKEALRQRGGSVLLGKTTLRAETAAVLMAGIAGQTISM